MNPNIKKWMPAAIALALAGAGYFYWASHRDNGPGEGFISGNGRIEATEVDVATKLPGRVRCPRRFWPGPGGRRPHRAAPAGC